MAEIIKNRIVHKQDLKELKIKFIRDLAKHMKSPYGYAVMSWDSNFELRVDSDSISFITKEDLDILVAVIEDELEAYIEV